MRLWKISKFHFYFRSQKSEVLVSEMKNEIEKYKDQLKTANSELDAQRSKNDVSSSIHLIV